MRIFVAGLVVLMVGAFMLIGFAAGAPTALGQATDTPTPTTTASASVSASASVAASASAVQPAAVPLTGGNPSDGSPNLALILAIALGAVAGTGGVLAASYGLTRRS